MIITCPNCNTQFAVAPSNFQPNGKRVKCSKCANIWFQEPEPSDNTEAPPPPRELADIPKGGNLPTLQQQEARAERLRLSFALLLILALLTGLLGNRELLARTIPGLTAMYQAIGLTKTDGLNVITFTADRIREGNRLTIQLNTAIRNDALTARQLPDIRISVLSEGGRVMGEVMVTPEKRVLEPGEALTLRPEIAGISGNARSLLMDIGNSWELGFRQ